MRGSSATSKKSNVRAYCDQKPVTFIGFAVVSHATVQRATSSAATPAMDASTRLSTSTCRMMSRRDAPSARRTANSPWRRIARPSSRLAVLAQAMISTKPTAARRMTNDRLTSGSILVSRNGRNRNSSLPSIIASRMRDSSTRPTRSLSAGIRAAPASGVSSALSRATGRIHHAADPLAAPLK